MFKYQRSVRAQMREYSATIESLERGVKAYQMAAKQFYFQVLFSRYRCPACDGLLCSMGPSLATCKCGLTLDPTVEFQKSRCCDATVVKKLLHYACTRCGKTVPSRFLFAERLFDREYFRRMVAKDRAKQRIQKQMMREEIRFRSDALCLTEELRLNTVERLSESLDLLCHLKDETAQCSQFDQGHEFDMLVYWQHVVAQIGPGEIMFSSIASLCGDARKDRAWLFTTLIFMEQEREVWLTQHGNDILVERA